MHSNELGLDDEDRDQPFEAREGEHAEPARRRMPAGTLAPPTEPGPPDLETLRSRADQHRAAQAWGELAHTLRQLLDHAELDEHQALERYAELAEVEGTLGEVDAAIAAWRAVVALDAGDLRALDALRALFEGAGRWDDAIDVIEKSALALDDAHHRSETLLEVAAIYEARLDDATRAAETYQRVLDATPGHPIAGARLEALQAREGRWAELVERMLERAETVPEVAAQIAILVEVAAIYERELGSHESAFYVLLAALGRDPTSPTIADELERLAAATGCWGELVEELGKQASELEATDPATAADLWVRASRAYRDRLAHRAYAAHAVQQALRLQPQHAAALGVRVSLEPSRDQLVERALDHARAIEADDAAAIAAYQQLLVLEPSSRPALDALERIFRRTEAWPALVDLLGRRAEQTDDEAELVQLRAELGELHAARLGDAGAAIAAYETVLALAPDHRGALRALAALYEQTGQDERGLAILETALALASSDGERVALYERIATIWEERFGKLDRAADAYERLLAIDAEHGAAYHLLERLYQQAGRLDALAATYRRHLAVTTDAAARVELARALGKLCETRLQSHDDAIEAYAAVLALEPDDPQALAALARLYEQVGDWHRAVETLGQLVERDGDTAHEALYRMGRIQHRELDDLAGAEASWLRGLARAPRHLPTLRALSELYVERGDWRAAATTLERAAGAADIVVDQVRLLFQAATIHADQLGAADEARRLYASVIALDPEHVEAGRPLADHYDEVGAWTALAPLIAMLCRKADPRRVAPGELRALHVRAARCAEALGDRPRALHAYDAALAVDPLHLPTALARAELLFAMQAWGDARKAYEAILGHGDRASGVRAHERLGTIALALDERRPALASFARALELDPHHRDTLEALIALHAKHGDWAAVVQAKRALLATSDEHARPALAREIATIYRERLQNTTEAASAYLEALATAPEDRQLLQQVLDLHIEAKQWRAAVEIIERFIALESDAFRQGVYFHAAATLCREELHASGEAVDLYNCALDAFFAEPERLDDEKLPRALRSFAAIDKTLTLARDWRAQERAYRQMIARLPEDRFVELRVGLLDGLGEVCRSRLKQYADASAAFERAQQLDPDNRLRHGTDRAEILAELHLLAGPEAADKAIAQHHRMLSREPFKYDSYAALARIYRDTGQLDHYWCVCQTLAFLKKASPEEQQFYEQHKPRGLVKAKAAMSATTWAALAHPDENRAITAILGACWQSVAAMKAFPHKDFGLKREDRLAVETDPLVVARLLDYAARVLNVPRPDVYVVADDRTADIQLANAIHKSELCPAFVVRPHLLQGKRERDVAFLVARKLAFMRPEYYLRMLLPTTTELKVVVLTAIAMLQPQVGVPATMATLVQQYLPDVRKRMSANALEELAPIVQHFVRAPDLDLARWTHAVDAGAHRVAFTVCGDLEASVRAIAVEPTVFGGPSVKAKVRELVLFSISESYFKARAQLGLTIG